MIMRVFLFVITVCLLQNNVNAQEEKSKSEYGLKKGSLSLQFRISENFTLSTFESSLFSLKKHTSGNKAWRLSLGLQSNFRNSDRDLSNFSSDVLTDKSENDDDTFNFSITFSAQYLKYLSTQKKIYPDSIF